MTECTHANFRRHEKGTRGEPGYRFDKQCLDCDQLFCFDDKEHVLEDTGKTSMYAGQLYMEQNCIKCRSQLNARLLF